MTNFDTPEYENSDFSDFGSTEPEAKSASISPYLAGEAAHISSEMALGLAHAAQDLGQESLSVDPAGTEPDIERAADYLAIARDLGNAAAALANEAGTGISLAFEDHFPRGGNRRPELDDTEF